MADCTEKIDFGDLYSENILVSMPIVKKLIDVWDLGNGKNCMRIVRYEARGRNVFIVTT